MKTLILVLLSINFLSAANAASVRSCAYSSTTHAIELDVVYTGGCKEHDFQLKIVDACLESFPVQCVANVVDYTLDDPCKAIISKKISVSLKDAGLLDDTFNGAHLTIKGDLNSSCVLDLPRR